MSLRARLLVALGLVTLVALAVADLVTYSALRSFLYDQVDHTLASTDIPGVLGHGGAVPPGAGSRGAPGPASTPRIPRQVGGSFIEIRRPDGTVVLRLPAVEPDGKQYTPVVPNNVHLPAGQSGPSSAVYLNTPSATSGGPQFRLRVSRTPVGNQLYVGLPLDATEATLHRLVLIELAVTAAALAGAVGLGFWLVRLGLRPLAQVEETAETIAAGALDRRVPGEEAKTEVGRLARVLNAMLERIQHAFAEREATERQLRHSEERMRQFVADASHELRTPLAAVSAYAELFSRGADHSPQDLPRVLQGIQVESERMRVLVEDLVLLARLDEGRPLERQPVELVALAAEAVQAARTVGPAWPVSLRAEAPLEVVGDRQRLRQVLDNLLANVRSHTPGGTPSVVSVHAGQGGAVLEVADQGPGLSAQQADRVFERFYRADPSRARASGGSGLGLSIVAAIVAAHGGRVVASGVEARGTVITVWLPTAELPGSGGEEAGEPAAVPGS